MESEVEGTPLMAVSGSAGTLVLERPDVEVSVPGPTLVAPLVAPHAWELLVARPGSGNPSPRIWDVLAAWRAAVRSIATIEPETTGWYACHAELVGLRALYHALFDAAAAAAVAPRRMAIVGRPRPCGDEGLVVVEDSSAGVAAADDPEA